MQVAVKNVKIHNDMSEETLCFSAAIYVDSKKVAVASNRGQGACDSHDVFDRPKWEAFEKWVKDQPPLESSYGPLDMDVDLYVGKLVNDWENDKRWKRLCKKDVIFRLKGDEEGAYRTMRYRSPNEYGKVLLYLRMDDKYKGKVEEILNEVYGKAKK